MHMSAAKVTGTPESETKTLSPFLKACTEMTDVRASGLNAVLRPSSHGNGWLLWVLSNCPNEQADSNIKPEMLRTSLIFMS
jgi:hypothetical protein